MPSEHAPSKGAESKVSPSSAVQANGAAKFRCARLHDDAFNRQQASSMGFSGNSISTARYSVFSFLLVNLFEFFRIVANIYFLLISIL